MSGLSAKTGAEVQDSFPRPRSNQVGDHLGGFILDLNPPIFVDGQLRRVPADSPQSKGPGKVGGLPDLKVVCAQPLDHPGFLDLRGLILTERGATWLSARQIPWFPRTPNTPGIAPQTTWGVKLRHAETRPDRNPRKATPSGRHASRLPGEFHSQSERCAEVEQFLAISTVHGLPRGVGTRSRNRSW